MRIRMLVQKRCQLMIMYQIFHRKSKEFGVEGVETHSATSRCICSHRRLNHRVSFLLLVMRLPGLRGLLRLLPSSPLWRWRLKIDGW